MPTLFLAAVAITLLSVGCASPTAAPLPDARQLAEDPLDVVDLPQP